MAGGKAACPCRRGRRDRDKGYLSDISAKGRHHPARVPLHSLHQAVVPGAARGVQRRVQRALWGGDSGVSPPPACEGRGLRGTPPPGSPRVAERALLTWKSETPLPIWLTLGREPL